MIKKITILISTLVALLALNGCQNDAYYDHRDNNPDNLTTLFLVDEQGLSYGNVPYKCDSMRQWSQTKPNGEFSFIEPESCEFNFKGLDGIYPDDNGGRDDDIVRIVDYRDDGKGGIPYECALFGISSTYNDGSFFYDQDDVCTFDF